MEFYSLARLGPQAPAPPLPAPWLPECMPACPAPGPLHRLFLGWHAPGPYNHGVYSLVSPHPWFLWKVTPVTLPPRLQALCPPPLSSPPGPVSHVSPVPRGRDPKHLVRCCGMHEGAPSVCVAYSRCSVNTGGVNACFPDFHGFGVTRNVTIVAPKREQESPGRGGQVLPSPSRCLPCLGWGGLVVARSSALSGCPGEGQSCPLKQCQGGGGRPHG